ncbi:MAG: PhoH family protein [Verrucomicrobia bacterium]|nr:MAG: PhoH family protein [Verrucomicrobiota bacterium]
MIIETLHFENARVAQQTFGGDDRNLRAVETELGVKVTVRDGMIRLEGPAVAVALAKRLFTVLAEHLKAGHAARPRDFAHALQAVKHDGDGTLESLFDQKLATATKKAAVFPKTLGQRKYVEAIREFDVTFGVGPAGTGKTYLAMAAAVNALKEGKVGRIILTRPAVEAGEALGFLPGDLYQKLDPYLRPLHDALHDMMAADEIQRNMERAVIEIAPLAYMRGRTLNQSFIVLDEAQNTTAEQMLMFLTRLGFGSKAVITGDPTQVDLPQHKRSGLLEAIRALHQVEGISIVQFEKRDVVRHPLVQRIVHAYERHRGTQQPEP